MLPWESPIEENVAFAAKSKPTKMRSPVLVLEGNDTENVLAELGAVLAAACTNEICVVGESNESKAEELVPRVAVTFAL